MLFQFHLKNNHKDFFMRSIAFLFLAFATVQMVAAEYKNISYYEKNAPRAKCAYSRLSLFSGGGLFKTRCVYVKECGNTAWLSRCG